MQRSGIQQTQTANSAHHLTNDTRRAEENYTTNDPELELKNGWDDRMDSRVLMMYAAEMRKRRRRLSGTL